VVQKLKCSNQNLTLICLEISCFDALENVKKLLIILLLCRCLDFPPLDGFKNSLYFLRDVDLEYQALGGQKRKRVIFSPQVFFYKIKMEFRSF